MKRPVKVIIRASYSIKNITKGYLRMPTIPGSIKVLLAPLHSSP